MNRKKGENSQLLLFPGPEASAELRQDSASAALPSEAARASKGRKLARSEAGKLRAVLCGTYRKDPEGLSSTHRMLLDLGIEVLSPRSTDIVAESRGFVFMRGEEGRSPTAIEIAHLEAISRADLVWLHAPEGYVGTSASLELGYAHAMAIPIFASTKPDDQILADLVRVISSPASLLSPSTPFSRQVPRASLTSFQHYYKRVASERGYEKESARDCLVLMLEELGELARAVRKREKMARDPREGSEASESLELADVMLYVVHMANILDVDIGNALYAKEKINLERFLKRRAMDRNRHDDQRV